METSSISLFKPTNHQAAVSLLTRAFKDDPYMGYVLEDLRMLGEQECCLQAIMDYSLAIRERPDWPIFAAWEGKLLCGVPLISLPLECEWPAALEKQYGQVKTILGPRGAMRLERYGEITQKERPADQHLFLGVLGVDPTAQGRGHGRKLLDTVQEYSDNFPGSVGVFLDTENPAYLSYYQYCGFKLMSHYQL
jgi:ribosomal protein S18 acetylase RimI-like enzyme